MNARRPGLADYIGPQSGVFYGVHHGRPYEWSYDINKRLAFITSSKPEHERPIRRAHIILVDPVAAGNCYIIRFSTHRPSGPMTCFAAHSAALMNQRMKNGGSFTSTPFYRTS